MPRVTEFTTQNSIRLRLFPKAVKTGPNESEMTVLIELINAAGDALGVAELYRDDIAEIADEMLEIAKVKPKKLPDVYRSTTRSSLGDQIASVERGQPDRPDSYR